MALLTISGSPVGARGNPLAAVMAICLLCLLVLAPPPLYAQGHAPGEYDLKAAFIYRIAGFVDWPGKPAAGAPLRVCVLGGNPFGPALDALRGRVLGDRPIEVRVSDATDSLKDCHVLFVAAGAEKHLGRVAVLAREAGIFTVGDTEGFARRGVMLNFYIERDSVRFEINRDVARTSGIRLSSKLLSLARIVEPGAAE